MGNIDAKRDWGHARDYVEGMWRMLQQTVPDDYVLATGETRTVREFIEMAFREVGIIIEWSGLGVDEIGRCEKTGRTFVRIDPRYFRPTEVDLLIGNPAKARAKLGWAHKIDLLSLCREMVASDLNVMRGGIPRESELVRLLEAK